MSLSARLSMRTSSTINHGDLDLTAPIASAPRRMTCQCPVCAAYAVEFIAEASGDVCIECGFTKDVLVLDATRDRIDGVGQYWDPGKANATALRPIVASSTGTWLGQHRDRENVRRLNEQRNLSATRNFIAGILNHLERRRYLERAFGLFDVVRCASIERSQKLKAFWAANNEALKAQEDQSVPSGSNSNAAFSLSRWLKKQPRLFTWGVKANALAIACVYATIATSEPESVISLRQVIDASGHKIREEGNGDSADFQNRNALHFHKVVKRLRLVRRFGGDSYARVREDAPRFYVDALIDFFEAVSEHAAESTMSNGTETSTRKGKERMASTSALPALVTPGVVSFLRQVSYDRARELALTLSRTLEDADWPAPPGLTRGLDRPQSSKSVVPQARESTILSELAAYAIAIWAMEASVRTTSPLLQMIKLESYAQLGARGLDVLLKHAPSDQPAQENNTDEDASDEDDFDEDDGEHDTLLLKLHSSQATVHTRYVEIRNILSDGAVHIPWVLSASVLASGRRRNVAVSQVAKQELKASFSPDFNHQFKLSRLDIVRWLVDIVALWPAVAQKRAANEERKKAYDEELALNKARNDAARAESGQHAGQASSSQMEDGSATVSLLPADSAATVRFRERLQHLVVQPAHDIDEAATNAPDLDALLNQASSRPMSTSFATENDRHILDTLLFDSDEDPDEVYLRTDAEVVAMEATLKEDGRWDADEQLREKAEKMAQKRARREERLSTKLVPGSLEAAKSAEQSGGWGRWGSGAATSTSANGTDVAVGPSRTRTGATAMTGSSTGQDEPTFSKPTRSSKRRADRLNQDGPHSAPSGKVVVNASSLNGSALPRPPKRPRREKEPGPLELNGGDGRLALDANGGSDADGGDEKSAGEEPEEGRAQDGAEPLHDPSVADEDGLVREEWSDSSAEEDGDE